METIESDDNSHLDEIRKLINQFIPQDSWTAEMVASVRRLTFVQETEVLSVFFNFENDDVRAFRRLMELDAVTWSAGGGPDQQQVPLDYLSMKSSALARIIMKGEEQRTVRSVMALESPASGGTRENPIGIRIGLVFEDDESKGCMDILLKRKDALVLGASGPNPGMG